MMDGWMGGATSPQFNNAMQPVDLSTSIGRAARGTARCRQTHGDLTLILHPAVEQPIRLLPVPCWNASKVFV